MFTRIAMKISPTLKKNMENLGFVAELPSFNPAKRILYAYIINKLAEGFNRSKNAKCRGLKASVASPAECNEAGLEADFNTSQMPKNRGPE